MSAPKKTIMRSLGEFFGHIAEGIKSDPSATSTPPAKLHPPRQVVNTRVDERMIKAPDGRPVILRRTTVDEVEFPASGQSPDPTPSDPPD